MIKEALDYLGPATVVEADREAPLVRLPDRTTRVRAAMAGMLQPQAGDIVLVLCQGDEAYAIGLIQQSGTARLTVMGDIEIQALGGSIDLLATKGIRVRSPEVRIHASRLEFLAEQLTQRVHRMHQWVREQLQIRAGRTRIRVDGTHELSAERISETASGEVRIDGSRINLG